MYLGISNLFGGRKVKQIWQLFSVFSAITLFLVLHVKWWAALRSLFLLYISNVFIEHFLVSLVILDVGLELGPFVFNLYFGENFKRNRERIKGDIQ